MVKVENISFAYKVNAPIFDHFDWSITAGERWSIIGPSGCGKTTLLYLLAGLLNPTAGKITITNDDNTNHQGITGLVLQDYGLLPWSTAEQNVALGLKIQHYSHERISELTHEWMTELGIDSVASHFPGELSGGQRQRVAIARTLVLQPSLLLMDEPFASLDALTREDLLCLTLTIWRKRPSTMVLVTHNIEEAVFWGSHILVLKTAPNLRSQVIDNPGSGSADFRESPEFYKRAKQLRVLVEMNSHNGREDEKR